MQRSPETDGNQYEVISKDDPQTFDLKAASVETQSGNANDKMKDAEKTTQFHPVEMDYDKGAGKIIANGKEDLPKREEVPKRGLSNTRSRIQFSGNATTDRFITTVDVRYGRVAFGCFPNSCSQPSSSCRNNDCKDPELEPRQFLTRYDRFSYKEINDSYQSVFKELRLSQGIFIYFDYVQNYVYIEGNLKIVVPKI